ncbi:Methyltransf_11 domain-containing protein [Rubrivivax sp. A210]|nr:Methyltransf_11 domain-containing protein [Rubrivivax sp. A210]
MRLGKRWAGSRDISELGAGSRLIADRTAELYAEYLPRHARGRLVDLGCGKAPLYGLYGPLASDVTCADWPQSVHASPYLDRAVDLNGPLPFADAAFDTIVLSDVLEHLSAPQALWNEMARVLAPGGHAFVNTPFLYGIHEAPHDYARYTEFGLRRFARQSGLDVVTLVAVGGSLEVMADLLGKHLAQVPAVGATLAAGLQGAVAMFGRTPWGERLAARTAAHFPLGYFMVATRPAR